MSYLVEQLRQESIQQLRARMRSIGAGWQRTETRDQLIERFVSISSAANPSDVYKPDNPKTATKKQPQAITPEQFLEVAKTYEPRGLKCSLSPDSTCWAIKCGDKIDSGTMQMPLRQLERCCEVIVGH